MRAVTISGKSHFARLLPRARLRLLLGGAAIDQNFRYKAAVSKRFTSVSAEIISRCLAWPRLLPTT